MSYKTLIYKEGNIQRAKDEAILQNGIDNTAGEKAKVTVITSNTTLDGTYNHIICNSLTAITITLIAELNRKYVIKNVNSGIITVDSYRLEKGELIEIICDGTDWHVIRKLTNLSLSWGQEWGKFEWGTYTL